jgi:hypothetical protein
LGDLSFSTPAGALVAVGGVLPLAALLLVELRARRARSVLGLAPPRTRIPLAVPIAFVLVAALLGLTAAQPTFAGSRKQVRVSRGEVLIVLDTSRSMLASRSADGATRFDRATRAVRRIRRELPGVRVGLASLTDRLLPHLLPTANQEDFALTLDRAVGVNRPPPLYPSNRATTFTALSIAVTGNLFTAPEGERVAVVLTDGEGQTKDARDLASLMPKEGRPRFLFVQFWSPDERVFTRGAAEPGYEPDRESPAQLEAVAAAVGGRAYSEDEVGAVIRAIRAAVPAERSKKISVGPPRTVALAPFSAAAMLFPLGFVLWRRNRA